MSRRLALEHPSGNVCLNIALIFMQFRSLSSPEHKRGVPNGVLPSPSSSITSEPFPMQWRENRSLPYSDSGSDMGRHFGFRRVTSHQSQVTKSFRMCTYGQTPCFARFWPKLSARNSFRICTCKNSASNSFRMCTYEKRWVG